MSQHRCTRHLPSGVTRRRDGGCLHTSPYEAERGASAFAYGVPNSSTLLKRLGHEDVLTCQRDLLAAALDDIHESLLGEKVPTSDDWVAKRMYSPIYEAC